MKIIKRKVYLLWEENLINLVIIVEERVFLIVRRWKNRFLSKFFSEVTGL